MATPHKTKKKSRKPSLMGEAVVSHSEVKAVPPYQKVFRRLRKLPKRDKWGSLVLILIIIGVAYFFLTGGFNRNTIVIGDTRITKGEITNYANQLAAIKKAHPAISYGNNLEQYASDKLILNAALKEEAKKYNITINDNDMAAGFGLRFSSKEQETAYFNNIFKQGVTTSLINLENTAYQAKLQSKLLKTENLTMVTLVLDTPYFDSLSGVQAQAAYNQAKSRLNTEFMPLINKGEPESKIATKSDIAYASTTAPNATSAQIGKSLYLYFRQGVVTTSELQDYQSGVTGFNDLNETSWLTANPGPLKGTANEINTLTKVGQSTRVFASKAGAYMIFRLDSIHGGPYNSWAEFLNSYKEKYAKGKIPVSLTAIGNSVLGIANTFITTIATPGLAQAAADSSQQTLCTEPDHLYQVTFVAWDLSVPDDGMISGVTLTAYHSPSDPPYYYNGAPVTNSFCNDTSHTVTSDQNTDPDETPDGLNDYSATCYDTPPHFSLGPNPAGYEAATPSWLYAGGKQYSEGWIFSGQSAANQNKTYPYIDKSGDNITTIGNNPGFPDYDNPNGTSNIAPGIINGGGISIVAVYTPISAPEGRITTATCSSVNASAYMSDGSPAALTIKVQNSDGSTLSVVNAGTPSQNSSGGVYKYTANNPNDYPEGGLSVAYDNNDPLIFLEYVNGTLVFDGTIYNSQGPGSCGAGGPGVNVQCTFTSMDSNSRLQSYKLVSISGAYYASGSPGDGTIAYDDNSPQLIYYYPSGTGPVSVTWESGTRANTSDAFTYGAPTATTINNCYSATCSGLTLDAISNDPWAPGQGPPNGVPAGSAFEVTVTLNNTGQAPLPATTGDGTAQLGITATNGGAAEPNYTYTTVPSGGSYTWSFWVPGSEATNGSTISFYPDYYGDFALGPVCGTVNVYQPYAIQPSTTINPTSDEDPTTINYTATGAMQTGGVSVNATINYCLTPQNDPPAGTCTNPDQNNSASYNFGSNTWNASYRPRSISAGQQYCAEADIYPGSGWVDAGGDLFGGGYTYATPSCFTVDNEPYVQFFGSDVSAGGGFGNNCSASSYDDIETYLDTSDSLNPSKGSGSQFGAEALGIIEGFRSDSLGPTGAYANLTFANTTGSGASQNYTKYGGSYAPSDGNDCAPDYYSTRPSSTTPLPSDITNDALTTSGIYSAQDGTRIDAPQYINNGAKTVLYVSGNLYIGADICYVGNRGGCSTDPAWPHLSDIPSLFIIVQGNIMIGPGVNTLDGVYVAEANSSNGSGGIINTCAENATTSYPIGQIFGEPCNGQLLVNGAFQANEIFLDRSYSSLRHGLTGENPYGGNYGQHCGVATIDVGTAANPFDCAAEIFNFSPELYLTQPNFKASSGAGSGTYQYITSLPPVL